MKISIKNILPLDPCEDRLDNYLKHYGDREFTINQFMDLKHITHKDKVWVGFRLLPRHNISLAAADIAESALHIYENTHPNDDSPRKAIKAARSGQGIADAAYAYAAYVARAASAAAATANKDLWECAINYAIASVNIDACANYSLYGAIGKQAHNKRVRSILIKYLKKEQ